jgi:hypothetical protein
MSWKKRLMQIALAGGAIGAGGALQGCPLPYPFPCNANPDPCCSDPSSNACEQYSACADAGGYLVSQTDDAGVVVGSTCQLPPDGGSTDGGR